MVSDQIPHELVERIAGGNVALFLGSETVVRTERGQARPSWLEITSVLAQRCGYPEPDMSLAKVAQYFEMTQGRHALLTAIADIMADPSYVPAPVHQLIAQLPIKFIVTTNMDTLLEQALRAVGRWPQLVMTITDAAGLDVERTTVVKLFGDIERKEIVITEDDHYEYEQRSPMMADLIRQRLVSNTLLFVNCDLDDIRLKSMCAQVTRRLGRLKGRSYAVDPSPSDYCQRFWEDKETHIIEADAQVFLEHLLAALEVHEAMIEEERPEVALRGRPFKRLDYYTEEDAGIFYGREDETQQLISGILAHQLLVLVGASGTGKTSLLLAGAKPALEGGGCLVAYTRLMGDPLADLRSSIETAVSVPLGPGPSARKRSDLRAGSLRDQLVALEAGPDLVVFLDQFEEFFQPKFGQAVQQSFVGELARCLESRSVRTRFVISLRSEALINLLGFKSEIPYIMNNTIELQPLVAEQAARAIIQPLKRFGIALEEGLLERLVDDLDEEGINPPQLQIVCDRLYDRVLRESEPEITIAIYEELGGADTIVGEYLDEELGKLDEAQRRLARAVLQGLVTAAGTKEPRSLAQITERTGLAGDKLEGILGELDRLRLVRALKSDGEVRYELVHDYLAERISGWLDERARRVERVRGVLDRSLSDWQHSEELLDLSRVKEVYALRDDLGDLGSEKNALLLRSAARYDYEMDYWLSRVPEVDDQVAYLTEVLAPKWTTEERIHAIHSLSRIATDELGKRSGIARKLQQVALEDADAQVRQAAAVSLARTGAGEAVDKLAQIAWRAEGDQRTRAVEALAWVWDTNAVLLPDLSWPLYEKVARRVAHIRLSRARGSIRSVTVGGAVGGTVGFALGLTPAVVLNMVQQYVAAVRMAMVVTMVPITIAILGAFGLLAGAGVGAGISIGRALGPGRRVLAPALGGAVGGSIGFTVGLGFYAVSFGQSPLTVMPPAALAGVLLACGIAIAAGISKSPFAELTGGALGGALGFGLLVVSGALPSMNRILLLAAGLIIGLAIAYGIARREAPAAKSDAKSAAGGRP